MWETLKSTTFLTYSQWDLKNIFLYSLRMLNKIFWSFSPLCPLWPPQLIPPQLHTLFFKNISFIQLYAYLYISQPNTYLVCIYMRIWSSSWATTYQGLHSQKTLTFPSQQPSAYNSALTKWASKQIQMVVQLRFS